MSVFWLLSNDACVSAEKRIRSIRIIAAQKFRNVPEKLVSKRVCNECDSAVCRTAEINFDRAENVSE